MRGFLKSAAIFAVTLGICGGLLFCVCALIPQSAIQPAMQQAEEYFSALEGSVCILDGVENTRGDDYADIALFDVIYHVDASRPLYSMIAAPYYRNEGGDIRLDFRASVVEGQQPNGEYARYWHGSQVLLRPLLTFTSIHGCRAALFGLLLGLNAALAALLIRMRRVRPLLIYAAGMVLVQFWMGLFTLEYIMSFLIMTGACIAVAAAWRRDRDPRQLERRMTAICIISGAVVCFMDFLTTETLTFTVPVILWLLLDKENGHERRTFRQLLGLLVRWGAAWGMAYAFTFVVKWVLVYALMGREALMHVFSSASYRIDRSVMQGDADAALTVRSSMLPMMLARNVGMLFPFAEELTIGTSLGLAGGMLMLAGAFFYLFRGKTVDGAFIAALGMVAMVPYARMLALGSHSLDHYFFTYRAQMASIMAVIAILTYSLKPSEVLHPKKRRR